MGAGWSREDRPDAAAERILDAAGKAFAEIGVSAAGMSEIAEFAGCSRGTLYRYFKSRHELHTAYIERAARQIGARVDAALGEFDEPRQRLCEAILLSVREVRRDPGASAWFEPGVAGLAARMSRSSELIDSLTARVGSRFARALRGRDARLRARWIVRVITSLLTTPEESEADERKLVKRFVAPALL